MRLLKTFQPFFLDFHKRTVLSKFKTNIHTLCPWRLLRGEKEGDVTEFCCSYGACDTKLALVLSINFTARPRLKLSQSSPLPSISWVQLLTSSYWKTSFIAGRLFSLIFLFRHVESARRQAARPQKLFRNN
jgi:hypothetical protein